MSFSGGPIETTTLIRLDGEVIGNQPPEVEVARMHAAAPTIKAMAAKKGSHCIVCGRQHQRLPILMVRLRGSEVLHRDWADLCTWHDVPVTPEQVQLLPKILAARINLQLFIDDWFAAGPQDVV